jgi:hypothetical protein
MPICECRLKKGSRIIEEAWVFPGHPNSLEWLPTQKPARPEAMLKTDETHPVELVECLAAVRVIETPEEAQLFTSAYRLSTESAPAGTCQ